jgi:elongation factor 1-beta
MGEVIVVYKVMPKDPGVLASMKEGLRKLGPERLEEEPIGFGITAVRFTKIIPDSGGEQDRLEERLGAVRGVESFELVTYSRAM